MPQDFSSFAVAPVMDVGDLSEHRGDMFKGSLAKSDLGNLSPALFDLELSQHGQRNVPGIGYQLQIAQDTPKEFLRSITALCRPSGELESKLLGDLQSLKPVCSGPEGFSMEKLASGLAARGYTVEIMSHETRDGCSRPCHGRKCLETLHHTFIHCTGAAYYPSKVDCYIEPSFREQFEIGQPSTSYQALLTAVPVEFVGSPERLFSAVELLCAEIADAFRDQGRPLPPWRRRKGMLSKWFPPSSRLNSQSNSPVSPKGFAFPPHPQAIADALEAQQAAAQRQTAAPVAAVSPPRPGPAPAASAAGSVKTLRRVVVLRADSSGLVSAPVAERGVPPEAPPGLGRASMNVRGAKVPADGSLVGSGVRLDGGSPIGGSPIGSKRVVSLLAKGIAGMPKPEVVPEPLPATEVEKGRSSWQWAMPHINTVRRVGVGRSRG